LPRRQRTSDVQWDVSKEGSMKRIDVVKKGNQWVAETGGKRVASASTKVETVRKTAQVARRDTDAITVKIHKENGRFQEERTYPGKADPRSSKG
jgi:hypothetical protein